MNEVIFKVDDFLSNEFTGIACDVVENYRKFWAVLDPYPDVKISLGVIGRSLASVPQSVIKQVRGELGKRIELYNHSFFHKHGQADVRINQDEIEKVFGVRPTVYGAPFNDINYAIQHEINVTKDIVKTYKTQIPLSGYHELERWNEGKEFVRFPVFIAKYKQVTPEPKVYQMHPFAWTDEDRSEFARALQVMVDDRKKFIFPSQLP